MLVELQQQLAPLRDQIRDKRGEIEPQLARIDKRLTELGAQPAKDAAPEQPAIASAPALSSPCSAQ